jgi:acyl carrier protein
MSIKSTIIAQIQQIAEENEIAKDLPPLTDDLALTGSGLDSLMLAILITRLEDILGVDPFTDAEEATYPVTLGDLVQSYEHAAIRSDVSAE